ncbi:MAG: hypothetical protein ACTSQJ_09230 [Promethearchaeota archaeon]
MGKNIIKTGYCNYCEKEVLNPVKKPMDSLHKQIWGIIYLAIIGLGFGIGFGLGLRFRLLLSIDLFLGILFGLLFMYLIWFFNEKFRHKPIYCPECYSKLKFIDREKPIEVPEDIKADLTPKERVLQKVDDFDKPLISTASKRQVLSEKKDEESLEKQEEEEPEKIFCPFCGEELDADIVTCPFCKTVIK